MLAAFCMSVLVSVSVARIHLSPDSGSPVRTVLDAGTGKNCQLTVPVEGVTVKISTDSGIIDYFLSEDSNPSPTRYERGVRAEPGHNGVLFVGYSGADTLYCHVYNSDSGARAEARIHAESGDQAHCLSSPCDNGRRCEDLGETFSCECPDGWGGVICEINLINYKNYNDISLNATVTSATVTNVTVTNVTVTNVTVTNVTVTNVTEDDNITSNYTEVFNHYYGWQSEQDGYCDCDDPARNPCGVYDENDLAHAHSDPTKFCECDVFGQCFEVQCPNSLLFDDLDNSCK